MSIERRKTIENFTEGIFKLLDEQRITKKR